MDAIATCENGEDQINEHSSSYPMYLWNWIYALVQEKFFINAIPLIWKSLEINPLDA